MTQERLNSYPSPDPETGNPSVEEIIQKAENLGLDSSGAYRAVLRNLRRGNIEPEQAVKILFSGDQPQGKAQVEFQEAEGPNLSKMVTPSFDKIPPPKAPRIVERFLGTATGVRLALGLAREVGESGADALQLRKRGRAGGVAEAIRVLDGKIAPVVENISQEDKEVLRRYSDIVGTDLDNLPPTEVAQLFKDYRRGLFQRVEAIGSAIRHIGEMASIEVGRESVKALVERGLNTSRKVGALGLMATTLVSDFVFSAVSGVTQGISQGLGKRPLVGAVTAPTFIFGGAVLELKALESVVSGFKRPLEVAELGEQGALLLGGALLVATGLQTIGEALHNTGRLREGRNSKK